MDKKEIVLFGDEVEIIDYEYIKKRFNQELKK
jgi:hypothetical protein